MAESLLDEALGCARSRLEQIPDPSRRSLLRQRLEILDCASRAVALEETDVDSLVRLVRLALDLRDEIVRAPIAPA